MPKLVFSRVKYRVPFKNGSESGKKPTQSSLGIISSLAKASLHHLGKSWSNWGHWQLLGTWWWCTNCEWQHSPATVEYFTSIVHIKIIAARFVASRAGLIYLIHLPHRYPLLILYPLTLLLSKPETKWEGWFRSILIVNKTITFLV